MGKSYKGNAKIVNGAVKDKKGRNGVKRYEVVDDIPPTEESGDDTSKSAPNNIKIQSHIELSFRCSIIIFHYQFFDPTPGLRA